MDIPRLRLHHQHITAPAFARPADVVDWLVAVQAQDYAGAKWALGLRMRATAEPVLERAFTEGSILRTHLMRPTWHFVTPADIRWMLTLTGPRVQAANAGMYRQEGLDRTTFKRSNDALVKALRGGVQLTRDELRDVLQTAGIEARGTLRMAYLMMYAELEGILCSGPRRGRQFTYALLDERAPGARSLPRDEALAELARRYFLSRGPATVQDLAKWSGLTVADASRGLEAVQAGLAHEVLDGRSYWFSPSAPPPRPTAPLAHLLSVYDEYLSGYKDRSAIIEPGHAARLIAMGNLLTSVILVDGQILGTWKRRLEKRAVTVETSLFAPLGQPEKQALAAAARQYAAFLELPLELVEVRAG
jgi:hypothetical protein